MPAINFPDNPEINDEFTVNDKTWRWTGVVWETVTTATAVGPQGPAGGFDTLQVVETKSANYQLQATDAGKLIINSEPITITVQGIEIGKRVEILQATNDKITFIAGLGDNINSLDSKFVTKGRGAHVTIYCTSANTYWLVGDLDFE